MTVKDAAWNQEGGIKLPIQPFSFAPGEGQILLAPGLQVTVKVRKGDVQSAYSLLEYKLSPGLKGPAVHYHSRSEETFYVLSGQVRFLVNGEIVEGVPGTVVCIPRGTHHTFSNPSDQPATMLSIFSPGGFEEYFEDYAAAKEAGATSDALAAIRLKHDNLHV